MTKELFGGVVFPRIWVMVLNLTLKASLSSGTYFLTKRSTLPLWPAGNYHFLKYFFNVSYAVVIRVNSLVADDLSWAVSG